MEGSPTPAHPRVGKISARSVSVAGLLCRREWSSVARVNPWTELLRLSTLKMAPVSRSREYERRSRSRLAFVPTHPLRGGGRLQVRILRVLRAGPATGNQVAKMIGHAYDCTAATLSAMLRDGIIEVAGKTRGPTGQPCRLYGVTRG